MCAVFGEHLRDSLNPNLEVRHLSNIVGVHENRCTIDHSTWITCTDNFLWSSMNFYTVKNNIE
jgi:hypothetical protein